jgi:hypothetical protein
VLKSPEAQPTTLYREGPGCSRNLLDRLNRPTYQTDPTYQTHQTDQTHSTHQTDPTDATDSTHQTDPTNPTFQPALPFPFQRHVNSRFVTRYVDVGFAWREARCARADPVPPRDGDGEDELPVRTCHLRDIR